MISFIMDWSGSFFRVDEEGANPKLWIRIPRGPNFFEDCSTFHFMKTYHSLFRIDRAAQTAKPGFDWEILNKTNKMSVDARALDHLKNLLLNQ